MLRRVRTSTSADAPGRWAGGTRWGHQGREVCGGESRPGAGFVVEQIDRQAAAGRIAACVDPCAAGAVPRDEGRPQAVQLRRRRERHGTLRQQGQGRGAGSAVAARHGQQVDGRVPGGQGGVEHVWSQAVAGDDDAGVGVAGVDGGCGAGEVNGEPGCRVVEQTRRDDQGQEGRQRERGEAQPDGDGSDAPSPDLWDSPGLASAERDQQGDCRVDGRGVSEAEAGDWD